MDAIEEIQKPDIDITIHTDASSIGWGITNGQSSNGEKWPENLQDHLHVNVLELIAMF